MLRLWFFVPVGGALALELGAGDGEPGKVSGEQLKTIFEQCIASDRRTPADDTSAKTPGSSPVMIGDEKFFVIGAADTWRINFSFEKVAHDNELRKLLGLPEFPTGATDHDRTVGEARLFPAKDGGAGVQVLALATKMRQLWALMQGVKTKMMQGEFTNEDWAAFATVVTFEKQEGRKAPGSADYNPTPKECWGKLFVELAKEKPLLAVPVVSETAVDGMIDGEGEVTTKPPPETAVQAWNPEAGQTAQLDWTAQVVTDPQIGDGKFGLVMFRPDGAKCFTTDRMKAVFFEIPVPPVLKLTDLLKGPDGELKQLVPFTEGANDNPQPEHRLVKVDPYTRTIVVRESPTGEQYIALYDHTVKLEEPLKIVPSDESPDTIPPIPPKKTSAAPASKSLVFGMLLACAALLFV